MSPPAEACTPKPAGAQLAQRGCLRGLSSVPGERRSLASPARSSESSPPTARARLHRQLPGPTRAALEAAADPALTADFKTILD